MATIVFAAASCVLLLVLSPACADGTMMQEKDRVPVAVYYESLCPDSIKFFTTQLYPTWSNLSQYMNLMLVPFGKAMEKKTDDGKYEFECHHGPEECAGNIIHACALHNLPSATDQMKFINCAMSMTAANKTTPYPGHQCSSSVGLADYAPIEKCSSGEQGNMLLAEHGNKTMELQPKLAGVPSIVFNNKYMPAEQEKYRMDFKTALCTQISGKKPEECNLSKSSAITFIPGYGIIAITTVLLSRI